MWYNNPPVEGTNKTVCVYNIKGCVCCIFVRLFAQKPVYNAPKKAQKRGQKGGAKADARDNREPKSGRQKVDANFMGADKIFEKKHANRAKGKRAEGREPGVPRQENRTPSVLHR